jgi:hypothetical protein
MIRRSYSRRNRIAKNFQAAHKEIMRKFFNRQFEAFIAMFQPPFDGLWLGLLLYYVWGFLMYPNSQTLRGNLPDSDDYMYLTQMLDWLKGQSWYDLTQYRLNPPADGSVGGTMIPFSRLPMIPMAVLTLFFESLGLGPHGAATIAAMLEPPCLLGGLFLAVRWLTGFFVPRNWSGVSAYTLIFSCPLTFLFMPGHVDHHGLDILLVALALGCVFRMIEEPKKLYWGMGAGLLLALDLSIALEMLPWLIMLSSAIGLWAMIKGRAAAYNAFVYGVVLFLASAFFLICTRRPSDFFTVDLLFFSIVYVLFAGSIALVFGGIAIVADRRPVWRWIAGIALAVATGVLFFNRFPALLAGPFGGVDQDLATLMLNGLGESEALIKLGHSWIWIFFRTLNGWLALGASIYYFKHSKRDEERWQLALMIGLLAAALGLAIIYQYRFIAILSLFSSVMLAVLLYRGWKWIGTNWKGRKMVWAEIGLLLLVSPLLTVLIPALSDGRSFNAGVLLFPAYGTNIDPLCDTYGLEKALSQPSLYQRKPLIIMNAMDSGPELLFRTPHKVLAAPFHTDVDGNLDAMRFFAATDPAQAEAILRKRHVDLVVSCRMMMRIYVGLGPDGKPMDAVEKIGTGLNAAPDSKQPDSEHKPKSHMVQLLTSGHPPPWLKRLEIPGAENFVVYEVGHKTPTKKATPAE